MKTALLLCGLGSSLAFALPHGGGAPSCPETNPQGIQWAIYPNNQMNNERHGDYPHFDPTVFKTMTPEFTNVTYSIGGLSRTNGGPAVRIYDSHYKGKTRFAIDHKAYFYPTISGTYVVSMQGETADDIVEFWLGNNAYSGWTRANEDLEDTYGDSSETFSFDMIAGSYYAFRVMFGQATGAFNLPIIITDPNGDEFLGPDTTASQQIVQYSCDGQAPPFPAWGSET